MLELKHRKKCVYERVHEAYCRKSFERSGRVEEEPVHLP